MDTSESNEYSIRELNSDDEIVIQKLCERCSDYFYLTEGTCPPQNAANGILNDLPPGRGHEDKTVYGVFGELGELIALIDLVKDYPVNGEWIIGLLILDPKVRGKGMGSKLHDWIKDLALVSGAEKLRIGVVVDNLKAIGFWTGLGYKETKRTGVRFGNKDNTVIVMNYTLK